ncbi:ABC transporter ATP-binding protein [Marinobacter nauticus]|uniref:ABC transporter ATP-binding protein n=1 Tax=Marinobacter nauticus TaxID=2743 RepID=UPI001C97D09B|nr:ATP-binding cassette domain-containing protein [Marinobacter nauticus]MBY5962736.1 ATP-binding cassette domain-containing protein [Marinobacter nauticus]MBY6101951.1 ATP-binding cassette domain-containing protein [Marinobacter nauticus]
MSDNLISATGLSKQFESGGQNVTVLRELSVRLGTGESLALTGPSGSGKSTLLNILCGLESPGSGRLAILGKPLAGDGAPTGKALERAWCELRQSRLGVVFQDANLMPTLSLLDNIRLRARLAGQDDTSAGDWLQRLGIGELGQRYPDQISGGQRQRAALAMVFVTRPALILADEPTGSLDRRTAETVADELFELQARHGCGLVLATHDADLAARCLHQLDLGHQGGP